MNGKIVNIRRGLADEDEIRRVFLKRQDLMWKRSIMDEEITHLDEWLLQHKLPLDILIPIWSRAMYCEYLLSADLNPTQSYAAPNAISNQ
jgi:hypothetical protein